MLTRGIVRRCNPLRAGHSLLHGPTRCEIEMHRRAIGVQDRVNLARQSFSIAAIQAPVDARHHGRIDHLHGTFMTWGQPIRKLVQNTDSAEVDLRRQWISRSGIYVKFCC